MLAWISLKLAHQRDLERRPPRSFYGFSPPNFFNKLLGKQFVLFVCAFYNAIYYMFFWFYVTGVKYFDGLNVKIIIEMLIVSICTESNTNGGF